METPKIKCVPRMTPRQRKYDGAMLTHVVHLPLTTDEALLVSEFFMKTQVKASEGNKTREDKKSLIQLFLLRLAEGVITEEALQEEMVKWRTRAKLAEELSNGEVQKALHLLAQAKKPVAAPEPKPEPKPVAPVERKIRREFVPEPRKR